MNNQNESSNILVISDFRFQNISFNIHYISRVSEFDQNSKSNYDLIVVPILVFQSEQAQFLIQSLIDHQPSIQIVVLVESHSKSADLQDVINKFPVAYCIDPIEILNAEKIFISLLEKGQQIKQQKQLESLVREQNEKLKYLYKELEQRIEKRQTYLQESKTKSLVANSRWKSILKATEVIHQSNSVGEIEQNLTLVLKEPLNILSTRIFSRPQNQLFRDQNKNQKKYSFYETSLIRGDSALEFGSVFFLREKNIPFRKDEQDFLQKISEVISLAIDRLYNLEQSISFKEHWQATFNAISDPVLLINSDYDIIQHNQKTQLRTSKCYSFLFNKTAPCAQCQLGSSFRLEHTKQEERTFDVSSQQIRTQYDDQIIFVNQYHDISSQLKMERKIVESARLAEIGTIGSSIAHELNNPLGGMLSFTQLIKMDLKKEDPIYEDIEELERGVKRCRDIVQNLLGFTRSSLNEEKRAISLQSVLLKALKIMEIQSNSMGVEIKIPSLDSTFVVFGFENHLVQAFQNLIQNALTGIFEQTKKNKSFKGIIEFKVFKNSDFIEIEILDNGPQPENIGHLGLSIARQIIHDHGGFIEIDYDIKPFREFKITLPICLAGPGN